jgi:hypothetical protein
VVVKRKYKTVGGNKLEENVSQLLCEKEGIALNT